MNSVIDLVQAHEGLRLKPYLDTVGKTTLGWGRNLTDKGISQKEAEFMLANDLAECECALQAFWWFAPLDQVRRAAVMDMCFNLGLHGLLNFPNMISAIGRQDWATAAAECDDPHWHAQVGARSTQDAQMLLTGAWPT
jgi:lysozyme